jgi:hypothetical protein
MLLTDPRWGRYSRVLSSPIPSSLFFAATLSSSTCHPSFSHLLSLSLMSLSSALYFSHQSATKKCTFESLIKIFFCHPFNQKLCSHAQLSDANKRLWREMQRVSGKTKRCWIAIPVYGHRIALKCAFQCPLGVPNSLPNLFPISAYQYLLPLFLI